MKNYKLIIEYYEKGNNNSQIATLCSCNRMTVFTMLKRFRALELNYDDVKSMSEEEISSLLFPERAKKGYGYFYFLDENGSLQMRKLTGKKRKEVLKNYLRRQKTK